MTRLLRVLIIGGSFLPSAALAATTCSTGICSPLNPMFSSIPGFISGVLKAMVQIGLPIIAFFLLYAGFKFVSAGGNSEKIGEARRNLTWVIIGGALILGAWVLATLIGNTVSKVVGTQVSL